MPKLTSVRRGRARTNPKRRRRAAAKPKAAPKFQVVRGSRRNPVVMAFESGERAARRLATWFRHHSGNRTVRVEKFKPTESK